jgi:hypothetical protein
MTPRVHFYTSLLLTLAMAVLLSACGTTVNWHYRRTPSTAFAQPQTTPPARSFKKRPTNIQAYPDSLWCPRAGPRSWPGWPWLT